MPHVQYKQNPTTTVIHATHCCGIMEIDYLGVSQTPLDALKSIQDAILTGGTNDFRRYPRFVTFSGVVGIRVANFTHDGSRKDDYGQALADFIVANKLGTVIATEPRTNWTRNEIKLWVWTVDVKSLTKFYDALVVPPIEPVVVEETNG